MCNCLLTAFIKYAIKRKIARKNFGGGVIGFTNHNSGTKRKIARKYFWWWCDWIPQSQ